MDNHQLSADLANGCLRHPRTPTPLVWTRRLGERVGLARLFLKLEGASVTKNHKYGLALVAVEACRRQKQPGIALASCGHLAFSVATVCKQAGIPCRLFLVAGCPLDFELLAAHVDDSYRSYESAVKACERWSRKHRWLNATPGYDLCRGYVDEYMLVSEEITAEIGAPDVLICPVGNGTTLAGIFKGFVTVQGVETPKHYGATTVENRFVGGRPSNKMDWDLEPLRSAEPLDEVAAMRAISTTGGRFIGLSRRSMLEATRLLWETEHIRCHPASAIVIAAAHSLRISGELRRDEDIVAILTTGE